MHLLTQRLHNKSKYVLLGALLLVPACAKKKKESTTVESLKKTTVDDSLFLQDIKTIDYQPTSKESEELCLMEYQSFFVDVFIPLYSKRWIINYNDKQEPSLKGLAMGFIVPTDRVLLEAMYCEQMAILGWRLIKDFSGSDESVLLFELPHKLCCVYMVKAFLDRQTELHLFLGLKT